MASNASYFIEIGVLVPAILSAAMPSPFTMRTFSHDEESVKTLRIGEFVGAGMVLALGIAESIQYGTIAPFILVLVVGASWYLFIEWAIRSPIHGGKNMTQGTAAATAPAPVIANVGV